MTVDEIVKFLLSSTYPRRKHRGITADSQAAPQPPAKIVFGGTPQAAGN
jgi:hypothetical protein